MAHLAVRVYCIWPTDHAIDHSSVGLNRLIIHLVFNEVSLFTFLREHMALTSRSQRTTLKCKSFQGSKVDPRHWPIFTCFTHPTPLCYTSAKSWKIFGGPLNPGSATEDYLSCVIVKLFENIYHPKMFFNLTTLIFSKISDAIDTM